MNMKKILCVLLCVVLLCGCGAPAAEETTPDTTAATSPELTDTPLSD